MLGGGTPACVYALGWLLPAFAGQGNDCKQGGCVLWGILLRLPCFPRTSAATAAQRLACPSPSRPRCTFSSAWSRPGASWEE